MWSTKHIILYICFVDHIPIECPIEIIYYIDSLKIWYVWNLLLSSFQHYTHLIGWRDVLFVIRKENKNQNTCWNYWP